MNKERCKYNDVVWVVADGIVSRLIETLFGDNELVNWWFWAIALSRRRFVVDWCNEAGCS